MQRYVVMSLVCLLTCSGCASSRGGKFILLENVKKTFQKENQDVESIKTIEISEVSNEWVPAETNRIWVNSYVDKNGNLVEGHYQHIILEQGYWSIADGTRSETNTIQ